ncbi:MAG: AmmeMemoRadiSam system protein B [Proteobacteria bacterium]|nr:AmmeMemoRadiSam system protein B [Pseudomonadota bacterium]
MRVFATRVDARPAAVAGLFYPADPDELHALLDALLSGPVPVGPAPKALIVPHAGYPYSGKVAGRAFRTLVPVAARIRRVVLVGPSHREWFRGLALPRATAFTTPLGRAEIDAAGVAQLAALRGVIVADAPHAREHSLEVQLPFLQRIVPGAPVVPVLVGEATATDVEAMLEAIWGGPETVIVVSSDLSHYHTYEAARARDARTATEILAARPTLDGSDACGSVPVNGLLRAARRHHMRVELLDQCSSGDTAGDHARVVGYGAFGFYDA